MGTIYLNVRCKQILQILLESDNYVTLPDIAKQLSVSKRSIYYDMCKINEWLEENAIPELEVIRGKGLLLQEAVKQQIEDCAEDIAREEAYVFSPMERVHIIICSIIYSNEPVYIDKLTDYCRVSRNTIFNDLRVVVNQLQKYDLNLEYESKKGYLVEGDSIKARAVFLLNFNKLQTIFTNVGLKFIDKDRVSENVELLKKVEQELQIEYVPGNLEGLAVLLPMMEQGNENLYFANLKKEELESKKEYALVERYFPQLIEKERIYLCLHLLGARVINTSDDIFDNCTNQTVYEITKALVSEFEKMACVIFENREELERELFVHINSSMYRYQYGIQYLDSMDNDVMREYPELFGITKIVSRYLEKQIGLPIPDTEVAYLALHFGAYLPIPDEASEKLRVLIVCANGISTGNMLKRELKQMMPEIQIVGVKSVVNIQNAQKVCDVIVSTIKMKSVVPVIQVHPILTDQDRRNLLRQLRMKDGGEPITSEGILSIIKPYLRKEDQDQVRRQLEAYLYSTQDKEMTDSKKNHRTLIDILELSNIKVHQGDFGWEQALWESGQCLIQKGVIAESYIENIIAMLYSYGPYMFISSRVILAHAKPGDGVLQLGCSLHIFREPIEFSPTDHANIVLVLAAENQESHIKVLRDIVSIFSEEDLVDQILQQDSQPEILQFLEDTLEELNQK